MPTTTPSENLFDSLEPRCLLATFVVQNLNDAGPGSFRQAVADANASVGVADVIDFVDQAPDGSIVFSSRITVSDDLTIIGQGQSALTFWGQNATQLLNISPGATVEIRDLMIAGGANAIAGGIENAGDLTLTNVKFLNNTTPSGEAGAIFNTGTATLNACTFTGNTTNNGGAGAITSLGTLAVDNSTFTGNTATGAGGGGAIFVPGGVVSISNSTFSENTNATGPGGAVANSGTAVIADSTFTGNSGADGGGIFNNGALTLTGSTLSDNQATRGAGIFGGGFGSTLNIANSTISGNTAADFGGGIFNASNNTLNLDNSTLTLNDAGSSGGGIHSNGAATIRSTIIGGNVASDFTGSTVLGAGSINNLIGDGASAGGLTHGVNGNIVGQAPLLGPLADHGGPTFVHALLPGSPAIGTGLNPGSLPFDQRGPGFPRVRAGAVDIGAIEFGSVPSIGSLDPSATSVVRGQGITLTAATVVNDGPIARVEFYRDVNNDGLASGPAELVGADTNGSNGFSMRYDAVAGVPLGATRFIAIAIAGDGAQSEQAETLVTITNATPTIGAITPSSPAAAQGEALTLTAASAADPDGTIESVRFYADLNANGVADADELLGTDVNPVDGFSYTVTSAQTLALPLGPVTFLGVVVDADGGVSNISTTTATILFPLRIGDGRVVGTASGADKASAAALNVGGHVIVFEEGWSVADLQLVTGASDAIGDPIIWTDPKDGLVYVAAPTTNGLILFRRAADGSWSDRNLTIEVHGDEETQTPPTHGLTSLISIDGAVLIAGMTVDGKIVVYQQTSTGAEGPLFNLVNVSADLEAQGMQTPRLESLISYVPTWDAWHLAGIDDAGRIQSVWFNPRVDGFTKWRVDDLTAVTNAPPITGQLAVTLTSWGGINLTGLNAEGNLLTTWWVPQFGGDWRVNNLTDEFNGSPLTAGNVSGYTTPWGGLNYVGLDVGGRVVVYWWAPAVTDWSVTPLLPESVPATSRPAGELTSFASPAGTLNVYGASAGGDAIRMWWKPGAEANWTAENLSGIAQRQ